MNGLNTDKILKLANFIEQTDDVCFDMESTVEYHECGTSACIAGFACLLWEEKKFPLYCDEDDDNESWEEVIRLARRHLMDGANNFSGFNKLFMPEEFSAWWMERDPQKQSYISRNRAAAQLRYLAKYGRVDWTQTPNELREESCESI